MSLFPNEDILTKVIDSWKGFADSLSPSEDRELFLQMLNDCYKYAQDKFDANGKLTDENTKKFLRQLLENLADSPRKLQNK